MTGKNHKDLDLKFPHEWESSTVQNDEKTNNDKKLIELPPKDNATNLDLRKNDKQTYGSNVSISKEIDFSVNKLEKIKAEVSKTVIGQEKVVNDMLVCLMCEGSALLEGVPGIAKTLIMKSLASAIGCNSKRIQFTADLLPTDITGFMAYSREKGFFVVKGPIFANFVLADEINRAPPKVQSALIEVMQEKQVTIGRQTFKVDRPFVIFATENPLENKGVFKLPEAQVDRFLYKIIVEYPTKDEEEKIMDTNITLKNFDDFKIKPVATPKDILKMQEIVKKIFVHEKVKKYIIDIITSTRPSKENTLEIVNKYVEWGASPRASINIYLAARANALLAGRSFVIPQDVKDVAYNVLRHRVLLNYQGQIDNMKSENIITEVLNKIKVP
nr:ATPase [Nanoarchaeum sp.]